MPILVVLFIFGLLIGSFLNAVIYRLPRKISIVFPRSRCTNCNKLIYWYENIPVFSWLFLRGKCSGCGTRIHFKYPLIELFTGFGASFLFTLPIVNTNLSLWAFYFAILCVFIVVFVIDLEHKLIPDPLNILLALLFLSFSVLKRDLVFWLSGGLIGFLFPLFITWAFYKLKGQIGLGGGDIKLYGALGLILGPLEITRTIFFSCFLGAIVGGSLILIRVLDRNTPIPFGPFIILTAIVQLYFPDFFAQLISITLPF